MSGSGDDYAIEGLVVAVEVAVTFVALVVSDRALGGTAGCDLEIPRAELVALHRNDCRFKLAVVGVEALVAIAAGIVTDDTV